VYHNAGATVVQELAFALAEGAEYLTELRERGGSAADVAAHLPLHFAVGSSYFLEIAKLRAAHLLWPRVVTAFAPHAEMGARIQAHTSEWNQTVYDPHVNLLRATTEAMAAAIGGCESLTVLPFTGTWQPSDDLSRRLAVNTQLILRDEAHFDKVADPAAGSWYIETMTDSVAEAAWDLFQTIESHGGMTQAIASGFVRDTIAKSRRERELLVEQRRRVFVGTNQYPNPKERANLPSLPAQGRGAEPFERIRLATEHSGRTPNVLLVVTGDPKMRRARADFSANFFGCAGFRIEETAEFDPDAEADLIVLCSSDAEYLALAQSVCPRAKAPVIVAGYPKDSIDQLRAAGVADFIHIRSNAVESLSRWQKQLGIAE
jgi:methylmalonyl-CoA mutase